MTTTAAHQITIVTDGEGNCTAHKAGCADLRQPRNNKRLGNQETYTFSSKREVIETIYGGFEDLEDDPENWAAFASHQGFQFIACCDKLLPAETVAEVPAEPVVETASPVACLKRMAHPHLLADSAECNPAYVAPTVVDFDGTPIKMDDKVQINSATSDNEFVGSCIGTVVGIDNGVLLVESATGSGVEETRPVRVRVVAPVVEVVEVVDVDGTPIVEGARVAAMSIFGAFESGDIGKVNAITPDGGLVVAWDFGATEPASADRVRVVPAEPAEFVHPDAGQPFHSGFGLRNAYVVGQCGHAVARSEWAAGFRVCERCPAVKPAAAGVALNVPVNINGETVWLDARMVETFRTCLACAAGHAVVNFDRDAARELFDLLAGPLASAANEQNETD